ncbi:hypothetical protein F5X68DRAFT_238577 [Plectosphaerella plurivora]|uniref:Uncharacterized protein n=1 Tax=Plectosphaerella plurivora TaxID=936078 RepID=A0A9P8VNK1_9PEZI|nr:hypothetical protein F5X68DRAFT_238577 [Plectosphaerella plurivora]
MAERQKRRKGVVPTPVRRLNKSRETTRHADDQIALTSMMLFAPPPKPRPMELFDEAKSLPRETTVGFTVGYVALDYDTIDARRALGTKTMDLDPAFKDVVETGNRSYSIKTTLHDRVAMNGLDSLPLINIASDRVFRVVTPVINDNGTIPTKLTFFVLANPDESGICEAYRCDGINNSTLFLLPQFRNDKYTSRQDHLETMRATVGDERSRLIKLLPSGVKVRAPASETDPEGSANEVAPSTVVAGLNTKPATVDTRTKRPLTSQHGGTQISQLPGLPINSSRLMPPPPKPLLNTSNRPSTLIDGTTRDKNPTRSSTTNTNILPSIETADPNEQMRPRSHTMVGQPTSGTALVMTAAGIMTTDANQPAGNGLVYGRDVGLYLVIAEQAECKLERRRVEIAWEEFLSEHPDFIECVGELTPDQVYDMVVTFEEEKCVKEYQQLRATIFTYAKRLKQIAPGSTINRAALAHEAADHIKQTMRQDGNNHIGGVMDPEDA